jgi:hypothetical protein
MPAVRSACRAFLLAGTAVWLAACGDAVTQGTSSVFLTLNQLSTLGATGSNTLQSDVSKNVADLGQAIFSLAAKDLAIAPTTNNQVTLTQYHVAYRRADGLATPGVDVPYAFDGATTGTVPPAGSLTVTFVLVRQDAKQETPLVQLNNTTGVITTIADVTFYGTDQTGHAITVTGSMQVDFGNFSH